MPKVELAGGLNLHYEQLGSGPDVAFIHGVGGNLATWHFRIVPALWDRYRCLTYDLRGHGYSDATENGYTCTDQAQDLLQLLDALEIERADLVGHSFGADVALYFAYLYPDRVGRVVLIEALVPALVPSPMKALRAHQDWTAGILEKAGIPIPKSRRYERGFMLREALKYPNKWGPMKDLPGSWKTERMADLFEQTSIVDDLVVVGELTKKRIAEIKAPVHLIYDGDSSIWLRSHRELRKRLPNHTSTLLKTGTDQFSHFLPLETPDVVVREILVGLGEATAAVG
jgi:pimeloyl-ACP methyl ester carboxylesterase